MSDIQKGRTAQAVTSDLPKRGHLQKLRQDAEEALTFGATLRDALPSNPDLATIDGARRVLAESSPPSGVMVSREDAERGLAAVEHVQSTIIDNDLAATLDPLIARLSAALNQGGTGS